MREREESGPPRPVVTVSGGPSLPAQATDEPDPRSSRGGWVLLAAVLVVGAAVLDRPAPPAPPPSLEVALSLAPGPLVGSQSGVLLLPVEVDVSGPASRLTGSVLWAEPVRQETVLTGRTRFEADATGRVMVLLQPDCRMLAPSQGHRMVVTVELELVGPQRQRARAVLDLGRESAVADRVATLCAPTTSPPV